MAKISQKKLDEFLAETRRNLSAGREETEPRVRQNDVDEFLTAFRSDLEASYTQEERDQMKAARAASLRPGETRRSQKSAVQTNRTDGWNERYSRIRSNADYGEKSQFRSTKRGEPVYNALLNSYTDSGYGDALYDYINGDRKAAEVLRNRMREGDPLSVTTDLSFVESMTDEERADYNYIHATEGAKQAERYLTYLREDLNRRQRESEETKLKEYAEAHPVKATIESIATAPLKGLTYAGQAAEAIAGGELDPNASYNRFAYAPNTIRSTVSDQIEEKWGKAGSFGYNVAMSMADFLTASGMSGGSGLSMAIMGSGAAADAALDALDRGIDGNRALALGAVAGAAEYLTEKFSVEQLFQTSWSENALKYVLKNVFTEAGEESASAIINTIADVLISGDKSEWQQMVLAYKEQGFSDKEALKKTFWEHMKMLGLDALGGAISGGLMAGGGAAAGAVGIAAANRENVREAQDTWRDVRIEKERSDAVKLTSRIETEGFGEEATDVPVIVQRPEATSADEEFELGSEVRRDQLMTLEEQYEADRIDKAIKQGDELTATAIKYGASKKQLLQAQTLADLTGKSVEFFRQKSKTGAAKNGFYDGSKIYLNVNSKRVVPTTFAHELTHTLEGSPAYDVLRDQVMLMLRKDGVDIDAKRQETLDFYRKAGVELPDQRAIDADIVAEYVGTRLLTNVSALKQVYRENPSLGRRIASAADKIIIRATGMQNQTLAEYARMVNAVLAQADEAEKADESERLREEAEKADRMREEASRNGRSYATEEAAERGRATELRSHVLANAREVDREEAAQRKKAEEEHTEKRAREISEGRISRTREKNLAVDALLEDMLKKYQQGKITRREFESFYDRYDAAQRESERYTESALRDVMSGNLTDDQLSERLEWAAQMRDPAYVRRESNFKKTAESEDAARRGSDADFLRYITENSADMPRWKLDSLLEEYTERLADTKPQKTPEPKRSDVVNAYRERQEARERGESDWSNIETNPSRMVPQNAAEPAMEESAAEYIRRISLEVPESERGDLTAVADEAEITQQSAKKAADAIRISAYDAFDNDEIDEETRDARLNLADEIEFTGRGIESSADIVDYPEGRIPEWVRGKAGAIREKLGIKPKEPVQYSISAEEVEDRVFRGRPVEAMDEVRWSISRDADYMDAADRMNEQKKLVPYNVLADARDAREQIRKIFTDPSLADSLNLPPENIGNTYIPNGSYDGTEENTTVCIRSMAADALMDAVAEHLGRPLTVEDTITVSQEYWQYTDQPECLYCYVAMDRKAYREFLGSYLEQRNNALADLRSGMSKEEAYRRFLDGRVTPKNPNGTKPMRDRFNSWVRYMENGTEMITEADLASEKSMQDAAARSPELAAQINDARKYAQGASWAKKRIGYTAYNNHILKWTPDRIRKLNSQFGLRLYSFSDFSPAFILENMQMITDASVRGLKMLAYTKDINFVKIFAPSGININISTFAYEGADGTMVQDGMQGADWAEAQAMRDQFGNVGITFVAVNDAQVDWAISQDWIDVVIPFHLVRTGAKVAESFGWKNYTQMSGDVKTADWTKGDKKSIYPSEHQNDRERYFEALRKNHLEPRFRDWADNPNYMKLVNETRRTAGETPAVQPVFDVDAAKAAIEEMRKRGGYYRPIGNTDENMREIAGEIADKIRGEEKNSGIQFSISEDEDTTPYGSLPVKAQNRVRDLERKFGVALDKMFGLGMTYKSPDFRAFLSSNVRPLVNAYLENGIIPEEESDALFAQFFDPATGADEVLQKQEFYKAFEEMEEGLFNVARWSQSQTAVPETDREESPIPTTEEAEQLFAAQRDARREMDKVMYRVLLKPEDEVTVGKLLRGDLSPDQVTENRADILEAYRVQKAFRDADAAVSVYKKRLKAELYKHVDKYLGNIANWKDKLVPLMYQRETMERNIRDIIPDKAEADAFIAEFVTPVHRAEAQRQRFLGEYRERVQKLNLSQKVEKGNQQSEAYAVQFLGEAADNIRILSLSGKLDQQRDGHTLEEWKAAVEAFWAANPNMNRAKIDSAIGEFRQIYNELLPKLNEVRIRNGYAPVAFRQGYFPHFTATSEDTVLARILRPFGIEFNADALPTSINGLTADFKPGITYFQFGNERLGFETTYDALQGYEMYLNAASDVIYHTDNIQKLRALAARIRYLTGDEGIKQQIDKVRNNDTLDEAEKQVQLEEIYRKGRYRMSNFVVTMDEYTNGLANKKSRFDRGVEELFGRPAYSVMKALESRVASNMIAGNIGSALTNIIPLNQANAIIGNVNVLKGMYHTIHGMAVHDGFAAASDFLTNRRGADPLVRTFGQKLSDKASIPMNLIDGFVSETIVRAAYTKNLADGMGEDLALQHADALAASIMADRSKGALPVLFNARNPLMKLFTQFQVEVNNEYSVIFKDIPELAKANSETKAGAIARITGMLFRYFVGAWLFNELYEKLFGRRAALDPVGMIANTVGSVAEGEDVGKALQTLGTEAAESLPFVGGVLGGGRVPIQSAIPDFADLTMAATSDTWTGEKKALTAFEELSKPAAYLLPPFLGGQIQKTLRGIAAAAQGGVYGIEGDEDGGAYLKYPVYDDPLDVTRSVLFGTTYTEGGQEWVDSGFKSLSVAQTAAYQAMKEFGADDRAAFDLIQEYKSVPTGEGRTAAQRGVIRTADIPGEAKFAAYYNLGASDSRKKLMDSIEATEPRGKLGEAAQVLMDISDIGSGKTAGTCDLLAQSGLSEDTKKLIYRQEVSDQKDDDIRAAELVGISFDEYLDAHAAYSTLYNDKTLSKSEQALEFSRYVDGTNLTAMQKDTLRDIFKFYSQIPVQAKNYNELRNLGISDDYSSKIARAIDALEPLPGKKSVSEVQKARVVVDAVSDPDERLAALGTVLSDSQYRKVSVAADAGLDPEVWVAFREILPEFDSDGNGSYTQEEMEDAIRAFSSGTSYGSTLMKQGRNLSRDEMAILWQIGGNWKSANNPFSKPTGKKVKDLLDTEKKG